jgi:hypothetical protein
MVATGGRWDAYPDVACCATCGEELDADGICAACGCDTDDCDDEIDDRPDYDPGDWGQPGDGRYL